MPELSELKHVTRTTSRGAEVIVLNTGSAIPPDAVAMLQALHSRSVGGLKAHLEILSKKGFEGFMKTFYVGYGHKSIGDCGTTTIFIEGVSMLVAKAIQDWALYSGQEASTRYIDFAVQPFIDPVGTEESKSVLEKWRAFYIHGMPLVVEDLKRRFPKQDDEDEKVYDKAIRARAFDILRGFLPAGASTNLAWHTNFRQATDHLAWLRHHPVEEVREVALTIESALIEAHPSSFSNKRYEATEQYNAKWMDLDYYYHIDGLIDEFSYLNRVSTSDLDIYKDILASRPAKTEMPKIVGETGTMRFDFLLDFGSYRDIQRHRSVLQEMPLLTPDHGFEDWYIEELPETLRFKARELISSQEETIESWDVSDEIRQYYLGMGYRVNCAITGDLPALVYIVEIRATRFVHPTLRKRARQMADVLVREFGDCGLVLHLDQDPDRFDVKRGEHDIVVKV